MDLTSWSRAVFEEIRENFERVARTLGIADLIYVPLAARHGDNVAIRSPHTPWYEGPPLQILETIDAARGVSPAFRLPVQRVLRMANGARAYAGRVESGVVRPGDGSSPCPPADGDRRGDPAPMTAAAPTQAKASRSASSSTAISISGAATLPGPRRTRRRSRRSRRICAGSTRRPGKKGGATCSPGDPHHPGADRPIVFVREMTELAEVAEASGLKLNDIASVRIKTRDAILGDLYGARPATGAFVLIDPVSNQTAAGRHDPRGGVMAGTVYLVGAGPGSPIC